MYKSPLEIINSFTNDMGYKIKTETDKLIMQAVYNVGVNVDKAELIKALEYDRDQYEKGYRDGKKDAVNYAYWIEDTNPCEWTCSNCGDAWHGDPDLDPFDDHFYYCPSCGAKMSLKSNTQETHKD